MSENSDDGWTSIPVRPGTRDKVASIKGDEESWTDTLERLVRETTDTSAEQNRQKIRQRRR